jgi:hypothetical protein
MAEDHHRELAPRRDSAFATRLSGIDVAQDTVSPQLENSPPVDPKNGRAAAGCGHCIPFVAALPRLSH